ncbi:Oxidase ustYa [Hyphodiscus hymeniophilus]|uniref:Oxidase ustYa n=1 Tax=Hyphodiscus hymeniophilus TaxID=353542 RepID=A0A9P6VF14_9HELO|nr:Oxidase ustYa [Hyphodiscus hymeniophilus]
MTNDQYTRIPLNEDERDNNITESSYGEKQFEATYGLKNCLGIFAVFAGMFTTGFVAGGTWTGISKSVQMMANERDGLLNPQSFIPEIVPTREVTFNFPTDFEDIGVLGNKVWDEMMPLGSGFIRVPRPRRYDMPPSKPIGNDKEEGEIYSVSMTHQLHCLGVVRHVIMEYEKGSKSRFAGDGHEYHCLDYIRQAILCAGDTTLDHAVITKHADGGERRLGFTGANSTHQCRDWGVIKAFLIANRSGNKTGILI